MAESGLWQCRLPWVKSSSDARTDAPGQQPQDRAPSSTGTSQSQPRAQGPAGTAAESPVYVYCVARGRDASFNWQGVWLLFTCNFYVLSNVAFPKLILRYPTIVLKNQISGPHHSSVESAFLGRCFGGSQTPLQEAGALEPDSRGSRSRTSPEQVSSPPLSLRGLDEIP